MAKTGKSKIDQSKVVLKRRNSRRDVLSASQLASQLQKGDRQTLATCITLVESTNAERNKTGLEVLKNCKRNSGKSIRIGITGAPGAGKSTFIEEFGSYIISLGHRVAVLAIDPSSTRSHGSILGDKTRMPLLSANDKAFIRPTASGGSLGGVSAKTPEVIQLCEAAGYDVILVETVGVGQSETAVHAMTDFFLLLALAGAGDELQGIKRGIMEMADAILVTKADGDNIKRANLAKAQIKSALHLFPSEESGWIPQVDSISALNKKGIDNAWNVVTAYQELARSSGYYKKKRNDQKIWWLNQLIEFEVLQNFRNAKGVQAAYTKATDQLLKGKVGVHEAVKSIIAVSKKSG